MWRLIPVNASTTAHSANRPPSAMNAGLATAKTSVTAGNLLAQGPEMTGGPTVVVIVGPPPVWGGVQNLLASAHGRAVRVVAATNPDDVTSVLAQLATPPQGWAGLDWDEDTEWTSTEGWKVVRLDGATFENVEPIGVAIRAMSASFGSRNFCACPSRNFCACPRSGAAAFPAYCST